MSINLILNYAKQIIDTGVNSLSDSELIDVVVGNKVGGQLLSAIGDLTELGKLQPEGISVISDLSEEQGRRLCAAIEIGRRRSQSLKVCKDKITSSRDVFNRLSKRLGDLMHEEFWVIYLKRSNQVLVELKISTGGLTGTVADPKIIFGKALALRAAAMILVHNHPSGNNSPSVSDINLTNNLRDAGKYLDLPVLDHVIIAGKTYYSFSDSGKI